MCVICSGGRAKGEHIEYRSVLRNVNSWEQRIRKGLFFVPEQNRSPSKVQLLKGIGSGGSTCEDGVGDERIFWVGENGSEVKGGKRY